MVGRLSNTPNTGFAYEIQRVMDYLTSHGVRALPGRRYSTTPLLGLDWIIWLTQICIPMQPMEVNRHNLVDGRISISFTNYTAATQEDEVEHELLAVLEEKYKTIDVNIEYEEDPTQYPEVANKDNFSFILVHKLTKTIVMIKEKTLGAAGIAARSSIAWNLGLDVRAGGMTIAQIIFEQIIHPNIYEVTQLSTIVRGTGGFGSTNTQSTTDSSKKTSKKSSKYTTGRWDTLGQPSGKFDYYVNYDIPKAPPDLELPPPSWDDEVIDDSGRPKESDWDQLLPKEKHALSIFLEEETLSLKETSKDLAGTTTPWASVPRSKDPFDDILEEDSDLSYIQYLTQLSQPDTTKWDLYLDEDSPEEFCNPFASNLSQS
ncbi:hypothetical protein ZIOFF_047190 [Zingiber officinale]|uniref:Uncharacterized protein n=1 Tax=Zingiber officinale TaxID=94328 RepID=A0A8J5FQG8_ZINOF|nr:hypothetical protein ZIOFF_047190 [Zingiber officinale]